MGMGEQFWKAKNWSREQRNTRDYMALIECDFTEEQASALVYICVIRHKFHCLDIMDFLGARGDNIIRDIFRLPDRLQEAGLDPLDLGYYEEDLPTEDDYFENLRGDKDDYEDYCDWVEHSGVVREISDIQEDINKKIEAYLKSYDDRYGTTLCPTGIDRMRML